MSGRDMVVQTKHFANRWANKITLTLASSKICALLEGDRKGHSALKLPSNVMMI